MRRLAFTLAILALSGTAAQAESCTKSREYLLGGLGGELAMPPQAYDAVFKMCIATSGMSNVQDAFMLRDGGVAVIPKQDSIAATAATLSRFCDANPRATLRFISKKEQAANKSMSRIVGLSSTGVTSCKKIKGLM